MTLKQQAQKIKKKGFKNSRQDSLLAHITPQEAGLLRMFGGSGRIDPDTGLPHFDPSGADGAGLGDAGPSDGAGDAGLGDAAPAESLGDLGGGVADGTASFSFDSIGQDGYGGVTSNDGPNGLSDGIAGLLGILGEDSVFNDTSFNQSDTTNFTLQSFMDSLGKFGKNALSTAFSVAAPGVSAVAAPTMASLSNPNSPTAAAGTMGKGLGSMAMSAFGPLGLIADSAFGISSGLGKAFAAVPAMTSEDAAMATANNAPGISGGNTNTPFTGYLNSTNLTKESDFGRDFLTKMGINLAGEGMSNLFGDLFSQHSQDMSSQPQASYPAGQYVPPTASSVLRDAGVGAQQSYAAPDSGVYSSLPFPTTGGGSYGSNVPANPNTLGKSVGNFIGANGRDLASLLYGFYNNNRQTKAINSQMDSLQGLFSGDSAYAQQARNRLAAQAAARGTRSNTAGRNTQLQALLAEKAASMAPQLGNLQQAKGGLQNQMGANTLDLLNRMGAFQGLASLFSQGN